ncbi:MAG: sulfur carrier protein ThiS [Gammaproteobacteria bacterium]
MKLEIKTGGLLGEYLPAGSGRNRAQIEIEAGATIDAVMRRLGFPENERYLTSLNGEIVPQAARSSTVVGDGDRLAILPPLKGG